MLFVFPPFSFGFGAILFVEGAFYPVLHTSYALYNGMISAICRILKPCEWGMLHNIQSEKYISMVLETKDLIYSVLL